MMNLSTLKTLFLTTVFMLFGCLAIQAADEGLITKQITIKLDKAGTLPNRISSSKKYLITNLKIVGEVNGKDLFLIREMAGCDADLKKTDGKLSILDLSDAKIVKSNDCYVWDGGWQQGSNDELGYSVFKGCSVLTSVTIPSSVTEIGGAAFKGCSSLINLYYKIDDEIETYLRYGHLYINVKCGIEYYLNDKKITSVAIPSTITKLGEYAFQNCRDLTSVYVSWQSPISTGSAFYGVDISKCTLYVPQGTEQDYWLAPVWGDFGKIVEFDATGIDKVTTSTDAKELSRYSVNGQRLSAPAKGLNIVKYSDGSVKKVAVQ
ncbi:MAG TPA: leucine-rich repeat domain-containing protein [Prevotella sp.]|jgi:hypothetical protein|nr:leucine-rich repeat domain-containing protein [Prevotella sp.]HRN19821.1 leucine-rich repeat domain-containing protein [Prevotella sp.]